MVKHDPRDDSPHNNLSINFLSHSHGGRNLLVETCKQIANKIQSNDLDKDEISKELVDSEIYSEFNYLIRNSVNF